MEKHFLADESKCSATNVNAAAVDTILVDYILFLSLQCLQVKLKLSLDLNFFMSMNPTCPYWLGVLKISYKMDTVVYIFFG